MLFCPTHAFWKGHETMDSTKISVRLDAETERRLREEARAAGKNESEVVREALTAYFAGRRQDRSVLALCSKPESSDALRGCRLI